MRGDSQRDGHVSTDCLHRCVGTWSAAFAVGIAAAYLATDVLWLGCGGWNSPDPYRPPNPYMAILEVPLMLAGIALIVLMAAVHVDAPSDRKALSLAALAFMTLCFGLTCGVQFIWLTVLRQIPLGERVSESAALFSTISTSARTSLMPFLCRRVIRD
jgi:hypothetical protein